MLSKDCDILQLQPQLDKPLCRCTSSTFCWTLHRMHCVDVAGRPSARAFLRPAFREGRQSAALSHLLWGWGGGLSSATKLFVDLGGSHQVVADAEVLPGRSLVEEGSAAGAGLRQEVPTRSVVARQQTSALILQ